MADHRKEEEAAADVHTFWGRFPTPTDEADAIVLKGCVPLCTASTAKLETESSNIYTSLRDNITDK